LDRNEAKAIYERGEEAVIEKLIEMDARLTALERRNAELTSNSTNSSKPPSSDGPQAPPGKPNLRRAADREDKKGIGERTGNCFLLKRWTSSRIFSLLRAAIAGKTSPRKHVKKPRRLPAGSILNFRGSIRFAPNTVVMNCAASAEPKPASILPLRWL
jgi:hypothetical protein